MANKQLLASKIVVYEEEPNLRSIPATATAVIACAGVTERGPIREPQLSLSWEEWTSKFGGYIVDSDAANAVFGIYKQNPGAAVWFSRVVHYTDLTDPDTYASAQAEASIDSEPVAPSAGAITSAVAAPFNLEDGDTLDIHCDEDAGGPDTVTFNGSPATVTGGAVSLPVTISEGFTVVVDSDPDDQVVVYSAGHATVEAVAEDINAQVTGMKAVVIGAATINFVSDTEGTDASIQLKDEVGDGLADIGHSAGTTAGTGNVGNIDAVTFSEVQSLVVAAVVNPVTGVTVTQETGGEVTISSNTTGASSSIMIEASSTADDEFGFDNLLHSGSATASVPTLKIKGKDHGDYFESMRPNIEAPSNELDHYFNLVLKTDTGLVVEIWPNLQKIDDAATDYVETVINNATNGSRYMEAEALDQTYDPAIGAYTPTGGDNGISGLVVADFVGDSAGGTGLYAFDTVQLITLLIVPGQASSAIHNEMISYCENERDGECFPILDPPAGYTKTQIVEYVVTTAALKNSSEHGAIYWPRIKVLNPNSTVYGSADQIVVPPSGHIAGVISRNDAARPGGQYDPPMGIEKGRIYGCLGFETDEVLKEPVRDYIHPERINPISTLPGFPRFIDGVWTLKGDSNFPTVSERRTASFLERQVKSGLQFARGKNNDEALRGRAFRTTYNYLKTQMDLGAFRSRNPGEAFYVDFSDSLNPPSVVNQYKLVGRVGIATQKPAVFVVLMFSQDTRGIEEELAG